MCPTFGAEPRFGTHPMAWAAPGGKKEANFLFDVATSQVLIPEIILCRLLIKLQLNFRLLVTKFDWLLVLGFLWQRIG